MDIKDMKEKLLTFVPEKIQTRKNDILSFGKLDELISEIFSLNLQRDFLRELFCVFEQFPLEDNEIFWSLMHGIESITDFEKELLYSIKRRPSIMTVLMINRILNVKDNDHLESAYIDILQQIHSDNSIHETVRQDAKMYIEYQKEKRTI